MLNIIPREGSTGPCLLVLLSFLFAVSHFLTSLSPLLHAFYSAYPPTHVSFCVRETQPGASHVAPCHSAVSVGGCLQDAQ
jgi:hypothetical protein